MLACNSIKREYTKCFSKRNFQLFRNRQDNCGEYQLKGKAKIIDKTNSEFLDMSKILTKMTGGNFPFITITVIKVEQIKPIIAPKYILYPETTEIEQIESSKKAYGF